MQHAYNDLGSTVLGARSPNAFNDFAAKRVGGGCSGHAPESGVGHSGDDGRGDDGKLSVS